MTRTRQASEELKAALAQFTGTECYHRLASGGLLGNVALTDGVKYLADQAGCYWLVSLIVSYQPELAVHSDRRLREFQFWTLTANADRTAVLTCIADAGEPPVITHEITLTDFPLPTIQIWVAPEGDMKILYLPSEH